MSKTMINVWKTTRKSIKERKSAKGKRPYFIKTETGQSHLIKIFAVVPVCSHNIHQLMFLGMDSNASLSPMDMYLLSNASQIKVLCKDHVFDDISEAVLGEVMRLRLSDFFSSKKVLETYDAKKVYSHIQSPTGSRCWLTPSMCQDHNLKGIGELIKRMISACGPMKASQNLIEKYIVKLTVNVSTFPTCSYLFLRV